MSSFSPVQWGILGNLDQTPVEQSLWDSSFHHGVAPQASSSLANPEHPSPVELMGSLRKRNEDWVAMKWEDACIHCFCSLGKLIWGQYMRCLWLGNSWPPSFYLGPITEKQESQGEWFKYCGKKPNSAEEEMPPGVDKMRTTTFFHVKN